MAEDLLRCRTLAGKTEDDVIVLLGKPEHPVTPNAPGGRPCYELGPQGEVGGLDNDVLCLTYGADHRVEDVQIVTF